MNQTNKDITKSSFNEPLLKPSTSSTNQSHDQSSPVSQVSNIKKRRDPGSDSETIPFSSQRHGSSSPMYLNRPYSHLPTPQSPNNIGYYVRSVSHNLESPVSYSSFPHLTSTPVQRSPIRKPVEEAGTFVQPASQTITPESSPLVRTTPRHSDNATPQQTRPPSRMDTPTPNDTSSITQYRALTSTSPLAPAPHLTPVSTPSEGHSSRLSSPFMERLSIADQRSKSRTPIRSRLQSYTPEPRPAQADDSFSTPNAAGSRQKVSTSPILFTPQTPRPLPGGEMERIRQAMMQDRFAHFQEAENRRPEYLKRAKRTLSEADPTTLAEDEREKEREKELGVGIMETPSKGRRLKLFQETSEESFEESLMAGGYGRYRTADWVRQPQPMMLATPGPAGPSNIVATLEKTEEVPLTEKEIRKRKRLAAFRDRTRPIAKLQPVELEGQGRVILDIPEDESNATAEPVPAKKKGGGRRKKKAAEPTAREKKVLAASGPARDDFLEKPNWPDSEFPWRLRTEERAEEVRAEEAERLRWIERFLDRDSDSESEEEQEASVPQEGWGVYTDEGGLPIPAMRRGRGKMVPIAVNSIDGRSDKRNSVFFLSDPADARAALLSKKNVRTLSYRQQRRRKQTEDDSDEEIVCVCNGKDDGRELVQCDGCQTWYHLQCIGIKDIAELGNEEDLWFCRDCEVNGKPPPSILLSEPTFVPTDNEPRINHAYDPPLFQPPSLQDSPMAWNPRMPQTPTRNNRSTEYDHGFSSGSSWVESSRHAPSTPQQLVQNPRVYTGSTPGLFDSFNHDYDESPFDPTSTPSRGIKFGAPFATPKNNVWSMKAKTPSKAGNGRGSASKFFSSSGVFSSGFDDSGGGTGYDRPYTDDESPIRRARSGEGPKMRRIMDSPLASRSTGFTPHHTLEESPIMGSKSTERRQDFGHSSFYEGL